MGNGENDFRRDRAMSPVAAKSELNPIPPPIFGSGLSRIFGRSRSGIGLRLLAGVLLFSSAVTLTLTALQLYLEYEREVGVIESRLDEIGRSYPDSLGESLWNLDQNQLELQLKGILSLPDVQSAEIREIASRANPVRLALGQHATRSVITREYPLDYVMQGGRRQIGVLRVEATLTDVYRQLLNQALVILASQAAKTFLVSFFILYLFHLLVTRHLVAVAEFVSGYNLARPPPPLRLDRRPPRQADELDKVIEAFNGLCTSLQHAYGDVRQANAQAGAGSFRPPAGGRGRAPQRAAVSRLRRDCFRLVLGDRSRSRLHLYLGTAGRVRHGPRLADRQAPLRCRGWP